MPGLTERERDLPALIGEGLTNRQIGQRLDLAEKTIENPMWRRARPVRVRVFRKRPDFPCRDHLMARMSTLAGPRASTFFLWAGPSASATPPRPTRAGSTRGSPTEGLLGEVVVRPMGCRADHPVALRLAARAGTVMMTLMWMVPAAASACGPLGLGRLWARRPVVRDRKWLR